MPQTSCLSVLEIQSHLATLPAWTLNEAGRALCRELNFQNFAAAFSFMTRIALIAERMNHHPDWCNAYNRLSVTLTTHDQGGVTLKDIELAHAIEACWSQSTWA